mgnify:CR=1 FL=1
MIGWVQALRHSLFSLSDSRRASFPHLPHLVPIGLVLAYVFGLRQRRPPAYDLDLFQSLTTSHGFSRTWAGLSHPTPLTIAMFERPPNGYFVRDMLIFSRLGKGGYVSKGFHPGSPSLSNSPSPDQNEFRINCALLWVAFWATTPGQYYCDSDYRGPSTLPEETEAFTNPGPGVAVTSALRGTGRP